jgi:hypothetical protein
MKLRTMTGNSSQVHIGGTPLMKKKTRSTTASAVNRSIDVRTTESGMMILGNCVLRTSPSRATTAVVARPVLPAKIAR